MYFVWKRLCIKLIVTFLQNFEDYSCIVGLENKEATGLLSLQKFIPTKVLKRIPVAREVKKKRKERKKLFLGGHAFF